MSDGLTPEMAAYRRSIVLLLESNVSMEDDRRLWDDDERAAYDEGASHSFTQGREAALSLRCEHLADAILAVPHPEVERLITGVKR